METNLGKPQQEGLILGVQVDCGCEVDAGRRELLLEGLDEGQHLFFRLGLAVGQR